MTRRVGITTSASENKECCPSTDTGHWTSLILRRISVFQELESDFDECSICLEPYKAQEAIRILTCR